MSFHDAFTVFHPLQGSKRSTLTIVDELGDAEIDTHGILNINIVYSRFLRKSASYATMVLTVQSPVFCFFRMASFIVASFGSGR